MSSASEALAGRYRILDRRVERGGVVYAAFDPGLDRDVTIRAASDATLADPQRLERFVEEARRLGRVQDPCVQRVLHFHACGDLDAGCYVVLERLDHTLEDVLATSEVDLAYALRVLRQALQGLRALHLEGIVHRMLRPACLWMSADGQRICIGDVGIGGHDDEGGQADEDAIPPPRARYAAPESFGSGGRVDRRSDLYALGMMAHEMLAGRAAFHREFGVIDDSGSPEKRRVGIETWQRDFTQGLTPLRILASGVSPALSDWVASLTAKNRRDRTPHAEAALRALTEAERAPAPDTAVEVRPGGRRPDLTVEPRPVPQAVRDIRRVPHPGSGRPKWMGLAVVAVLLAGGLGWLLSDPGRESVGAPSPSGAAVAGAQPPVTRARQGGPVLPESAPARTRASDALGMVEVNRTALDFDAGSRPDEVQAALELCRYHGGHCDPDWYASERLRRVRVEPFLLDRQEVTHGQFRDFVEAEGYRTTAEEMGYAWAREETLDRWVRRDGRSWRNPGSPIRDDAPVAVLSQRDAAAYCRWVGKRLPSEDEWELAARGRERRMFPWGNAWDSGRASLAPGASVREGQAGSTPEGIEALAGGVWEWTSTRVGPDEAILKGGSWAESNPANLRSAARRAEDPAMPHLDDGARCARDA